MSAKYAYTEAWAAQHATVSRSAMLSTMPCALAMSGTMGIKELRLVIVSGIGQP